ncbi:histidine kinase [Dyadobacter sp. CY261]|uniref:sensor histidine kinase n=1 Tax=Dyadobacter sp. CY261 TaxID=2907203 RepID=UPI001F1F9598|nr:histidine kinase [Dyadobacter sp. CY261]MCF0072991.1 histidine kinase [Dyadobacter sp. CY261]
MIERLLFPRTQGLRVTYHVLFWLLFVLLHYAYALPTLAQKATDSSVTITGFFYFLKIIPEYYFCIGLYSVLNKYIRGFLLFCILFLSAILLNHVFSIGLFLAVDYAFGLENMPDRFRLFGNLYLSPFHFWEWGSWLVFSNDLSEAQFMILPAALKMAKFAASENVMRQKLENEALTMELKALKSQINPHFVFNVLNAAYAKILPISEDASEYLLKVSEILRFSLYEMNDEFIRLERELAYMNLYVELESVRSNRRCKVNVIQEGEILDTHRIPTLSLITLVENAFKHGVHATRHDCFVDITISVSSGVLEFVIANSKPKSILPVRSAKKPSGGIGLINLERRLGIYYPGGYKFERSETEDVFQVLVQMPVN